MTGSGVPVSRAEERLGTLEKGVFYATGAFLIVVIVVSIFCCFLSRARINQLEYRVTHIETKIEQIVSYEQEWKDWVIEYFEGCACESDPEDPPPDVPTWP